MEALPFVLRLVRLIQKRIVLKMFVSALVDERIVALVVVDLVLLELKIGIEL